MPQDELTPDDREVFMRAMARPLDTVPNVPINTPEDWWNAVKKYKKELLAILHNNTDYNIYKKLHKPCYAYRGCPDGMSIAEAFEYAIENNNDEAVLSILGNIWSALPDARWIHTINGFNLLCDLCSESWVFSEGQDEQTE